MPLLPKILSLILLLGVHFNCRPQSPNGEIVLKKMYERYFQAPCKIYSFSQHNSHYRNDSLVRTSDWHEAIEFPDKFRIHFGDKAKGNYVLFMNDSAFNYREGKFLKSRPDSNSLLLILGGMFYREFPDVLFRLKRSGYRTEVMSEQMWKDKAVYVIGASLKDTTHNQIWIHKESLRVLRILENMSPAEQMDLRFEEHQAWCKGYMETKVSFRRNGKLEQVEEYYNIKEENKFPN